MVKAALQKSAFAILSICILTMANSYLGTIIPVLLHDQAIAVSKVGLIATAYEGGIFIGAFGAPFLLNRFGFLRANIIALSAVALSSIGCIWAMQVIFWIALRLLCGFAVGVLYVLIEAWILSQAHKRIKGIVFGFYLFLFYVAMTLGRLLLTLSLERIWMIFGLIAFISVIAIVPLFFSDYSAFNLQEKKRMKWLSLCAYSPFGVFLCVIAGLCIGALYDIMPYYLAVKGYNHNQIGLVTGCIVAGGALMQVPIGYFSDRLDMRSLMVGICIMIVCASLLVLDAHSIYELYLGGFFLGASVMVSFPLAYTHTTKRVPDHLAVQAVALLTVIYGLGSTFGPLIASFVMAHTKSEALLYFFIFWAVLAGIYSLYRRFCGKGQQKAV